MSMISGIVLTLENLTENSNRKSSFNVIVILIDQH